MDARGPSLEVRLLGPVQLDRDGTEVPVGGPRQRALLALLALRAGHVVTSDELVDELWAGEPPDGADTTVRSYVSRLRRSLGDAATIVGTAGGYVLSLGEAGADRIDALRFERLIREAAAELERGAAGAARERIVEALALWRGRPFGDVGAGGSLFAAAERLTELRLFAIEQRLASDLELGRSSELVDELEGLVREHPYRERLWRQLMLALYRAGRQADALAAYQRARAQLDADLGIEPGEELRGLEAAILQQSVPPPGANADEAASLPAPVSSFIGRERELAELEQRLEAARLVTLTGVGGVGKTRMALELARRTMAGFRDGAVFVDLSPLADPGLVAGQVAAALGVREQADGDLVGVIIAHLRNLDLLIVLDNCEHVRESAAAMVERVLVAARGVRILATSRAPLGVAGEMDNPVAPLSLAADSDAVALFLARARAARPTIADGPAARETAGRICSDLEGLPLAIELAAARARSLSLEEIAARLDDRFRFLVSWRRLTTARHRTLREAMDWSHELLASDEQALLAGLSVFSGGFDLDAVAAVCLEGDDETALRLVEALVDASLVTAHDGPVGTRYRLLDTVREYAAQHLESAGLHDRRRDDHATWALALAESAATELSGERQGWWFARLEAEHNNLRVALTHLSVSGRALDHLRLAISLTRFWYVRGYLAEGRVALEQALAADSARDPVLRRRALTAAASLALLQGEHAVATRFAEEGLAVARETGEQRLVANALSNLGAIVLAAGDVVRAGPLLEEAVAVGRAAGDERILALAVNNLGDYSLTRADYARARPLFEESLGLLRARGDTANVARALFNLGASELELGSHEVASRHFEEGLGLAGDAGDQEDLAWLLEGSAALAMARGDAERAATLLGVAEALLSAMGADHKPYERSLRDRTRMAAAEALGPAATDALMRRGSALPIRDAIELARPPTE